MPSQGSATRADGPPHGDTSSYPSMAGGRERGGRWRLFSLEGEEGGEESNEERQEGEEKLQSEAAHM